MMVKLHKLRIKGKIWEIIDDCHCDTESTVFVNGSMSRWVGIKQGVRQGGVLSGLFIQCIRSVELSRMLEFWSLQCEIHKSGVS